MLRLCDFNGMRVSPFFEMYDELVNNYHSRWFNEKEGKYEFCIVLPGEKKEDVKVFMEDFQLKVESKRRSYSVSLPSDADVEKIKAKLDLGLLTVTIEKTEKNKKSIELE